MASFPYYDPTSLPAPDEATLLALAVASLSEATASLTAAATSLRALASARPSFASAHPALAASPLELRAALGAYRAAVAAVARDAALLLPPLPPPTLEDVAPFVAQAGHHALADGVLAQLNRHLRSEERIWRAISKLPLGQHGRTRLMYAAHIGDAARVSHLIAHGADVCGVDRFRCTALDYAVAEGHGACAEALRAAGAVEGAAFVGEHFGTWRPGAGEDCLLGGVYSLAVCRGGRIAVGHELGPIMLRNAATGVVSVTLWEHASAVVALMQLRCGRLASASTDHSVRVWNTDEVVCEAVLAGHTDGVWALAELLDGRLASGSYDRSVRLWDVSTHACTAVLAHASSVSSLAALPQGGFAAGCNDGSIALWSAAGVRTFMLGGGAGYCSVLSLALLSDGRLSSGHGVIALGRGTSPMIRVWDVERRTCDAVIRGHSGEVCELVALPDGRLLSSGDRTLKVWDERVLSVRGGSEVDTCAATLVGHARAWLTSLAVLPDRRVVSGSDDGTLNAWR